MKVKNIGKAIFWYTKAADKGHPYAQYNLGAIYGTEEEVQDYDRSIHYFNLAAKQEYTQAQLALGGIYLKKGNFDEAIFWYERAIENGSTDPANMLELLYKAKEEFYNFIIDAEEGNIEAQYQLGVAYEEGRATPKNITEAIRWYVIAAKKGHHKAKIKLQNISQKIVAAFGVSAKLYADECFKKGDKDLAKYFMEEARKILSSSKNNIQLNPIMQNSNESFSQKQQLSHFTEKQNIIKEGGTQLSSSILAKKAQLKDKSIDLFIIEKLPEVKHLNLFTYRGFKILAQHIPAIKELKYVSLL